MKNLCNLFLCFLIPLSTFANWQRSVTNYERIQYQAGFQNWMIEQSDKNWMYFANSNGLLEFDGINWNLYPIKNKIVRSVKSVRGRIYVGGSSSFGYFEPDRGGRLIYYSLSDNVKNWGGEVWNIHLIKDKIYFQEESSILVYDQKTSVKSHYIDHKIDYSVVIADVLYLGTSDGIFLFEEDGSVKFLESSRELKGAKIVSIESYEGKMLVTTSRSGLYLLDHKECKKIVSVADHFIQQNQLFCTSIIESKIALGSVQNGVFIFDLNKLQYQEQINLSNGLVNNTVLSVYFDKDQNLWLGLDKGISYIDLNSAVQPLFAKESYIGTGYCSALYNNELYFGTNQGLYKAIGKDHFELVSGTEGQIWSILFYDNSLFCAGDNGITVITPKENYRIDLRGVWEIQALASNKDRLIAGQYSGFSILKKENNRWIFSNRVDGYQKSGRGFIEDEIKNVFWIANQNGEVQRIKIDNEYKGISNVKEYNLRGIGENVFFRKIDNNIILCTLHGIFQYSRITDDFNHYSQLEGILDGQQYYEYLNNDQLNNIWFVSDKNLKLLKYDSDKHTRRIISLDLRDQLIDNYENVSLLDSTTAIVAVDKAFVKIDLSKLNLNHSIPDVFIRRVLSINKKDSIISYGNIHDKIVLPYSENSISIHFVGTEYTNTSEILYSYRLKGLDKWSVPSEKHFKEYVNLGEGSYIFEVRVFMKGYTDAGKITSFEFKILAPWYRTIWAYLFYIIVFGLTIYTLYKKIIGEQKKIIVQKDEEIYALHNENLKAELFYKAQELNGSILNVIRKNEILEDVKKNAVSLSKAIDEDKPISDLKRRVIRLITEINTNIEHDGDFEKFQSNFDVIHQDFFKLLEEKYPNLTQNDKILCAYLKMNLTSKEIAPLLNISLRGVEVNRYRLRKKMNLDREVNLTEYLQKLK